MVNDKKSSRDIAKAPSNEENICDPWPCFDKCPPSCCFPANRYCNKKSQPPVAEPDKSTSKVDKRSTQPNKSGNTDKNDNKKCLVPKTCDKKPEKFCIRVNVTGFDQKDVKIKAENGKLFVEANQGDPKKHCNCGVQQLKNSYTIPKQADATRMTSQMISDKILLIEVPYGNSQKSGCLVKTENNKNKNTTQSDQSNDSLANYMKRLVNADFHPCIVELDDNRKILQMTIDVKEFPLEEIDVSIKDNDLIIQGERKRTEDRHSKRARFFRLTTLPSGAQPDQMTKEIDEDKQLKVRIPFSIK
ncbi:hypothetical protein I4U23_022654 [Adineta vaga]|nr:hypothetical protein I4U23_022654 [Adineta vaga]